MINEVKSKKKIKILKYLIYFKINVYNLINDNLEYKMSDNLIILFEKYNIFFISKLSRKKKIRDRKKYA